MTRGRWNRGIQARLSLALGMLALFALCACVIGWLAFGHIRTAVQRMTGSSTPRIELALQIAEHSARVTAGAPAIMASEDELERQAARAAVDEDFAGLLGSTALWRQLGDAVGGVASLDTLAQQLFAHIEQLDEATRKRLQIAARRENEANELLDLHERFLEQLEPVIDDSVFELVIARERGRAVPGDIDAGVLDTLVTLKAEGNLAVGLLSQASNLPQAELLEPLRERFDAAAGQVERALRKLPDMPRYEALRQAAAELLQFGRTGGNVLDLRADELAQLDTARRALDASRLRSAEMRTESRRLVAAAEQDGEESAHGVASAISEGTAWLAFISGVSLIGALLLMMGYVRPRVVQPIGAITRTMTQLAEGDTGIAIPGRDRNDELGDMAKALDVFRDMTVQMQQSNLREIEATRRRLSDAIESISEAFSLFDAEDRLVVFNRMYLEMVYSEIRHLIKPGISYRELMREAVQAGSVADARGNEEPWLARRMEQHRASNETHIMRLTDGRWILVSERRTAEGGVVAVYSDITELKERETELAEQTRKLQQLSNQLSKYLSPQVYQSIFSGEQTASVTARRKKLTVFFSDIAGFTESADRMESEDLTQLLNEYLTEMSRIALEYGATIDKYIGDAIMIFFGDPTTKGLRQDAVACVRMAIAMRKKLRELANVWASKGLGTQLITRTGIHTGYCTVGNFGSEDRMAYTIIGGAVNLASRLETAAKPGTVLISQDTYNLVHKEILCKDNGELRLKGLAYPVRTWQVLDSHAAAGTETKHLFVENDHFVLDANLEAMTPEERENAARAARHLLWRLRNDREPDGSDS